MKDEFPVNEEGHESNLQWLIKTYFSNPKKRIKLKKGDFLIRQNQFNDRLYIVNRGSLTGTIKSPEGTQVELFKATPNLFVGVYSYFSSTFHSSATVTANEASEVAYIDQNQIVCDPQGKGSMFEQFMPVIVKDLLDRQQRAQAMAIDKERTLEKLIHTENMAVLGQMSAGLAHELNNAIAVLKKNSQWLCENLEAILRKKFPEQLEYYNSGLEKGRNLSSREVRKRAKALKERYSLSDDQAKTLAQMDMPVEALGKLIPLREEGLESGPFYWEFGATFHDMLIAAQHAGHVVKSVKDLGAGHQTRQADQDVNQSIHESLTLLQSPLRKINVELSLSPLPPIGANKGELVQIWTNLINNACESMLNGETVTPNLLITSETMKSNIVVVIQDNGPGIPKGIIPKIFQPNVTTKTEGLSFGLGLGLPIVERLVDSYGGNVALDSLPGKTVFKVLMPVKAFKAF